MKISSNVPLRHITTFKIGGSAKYFCEAESADDIKRAIEFAGEREVPFFILGGGSNTIFSDNGFSGVVIRNAIRGIEYKDEGETVIVSVGAGEDWDTFVADTVSRSLWGLENLSGIPGTVGAAPIQNIGAYGAEVADTIASVEAYDTMARSLAQFSPADCGFSYRDSFFKTPEGKNFIITKVIFRLHKNGAPNIEYKDLKNYFKNPRGEGSGRKEIPEGRAQEEEVSLGEVRRAVLEIRRGKFPELARYGTAGSFFKNPIVSQNKFEELQARFPGIPGFMFENGDTKIPLAWILDNILKLKGQTVGNAGLWKHQPLVLYAEPGARAEEVEKLAEEISKSVEAVTGIKIDREVNVINGNEGR